MKKLIILVLLCLISFSFQKQQTLSVGSIDCIGFEKLDQIKQRVQEDGGWWVEFGSRLLVYGETSSLSVPFQDLNVDSLDSNNLVFMKKAHPSMINSKEYGTVLLSGHGIDIVHRDTVNLLPLRSDNRVMTENLEPNTVLIEASCNSQHVAARLQERRQNPNQNVIQSYVDSINQSRWYNDLQILSSLNRHISSQTMPNATRYIENTLKVLPGVTVTTQEFPVGNTICYNVVGTIVGDTFPNRWMIVGAHYDATSQSVSTAAPGAEDNGSGTASVLEMARIFSKQPPQVTMVFILYSAEEQGLLGSIQHAASIKTNGDIPKVILAHTMDMVAYRAATNPNEEVLLESSQAYQYFFSVYISCAETYTKNVLKTFTSNRPFGSDHVSYINQGIPALLVIDNDWETYPYYHETTDTINRINVPIAMSILKMNVAAISTFITNDTIISSDATSNAISFKQLMNIKTCHFHIQFIVIVSTLLAFRLF